MVPADRQERLRFNIPPFSQITPRPWWGSVSPLKNNSRKLQMMKTCSRQKPPRAYLWEEETDGEREKWRINQRKARLSSVYYRSVTACALTVLLSHRDDYFLFWTFHFLCWQRTEQAHGKANTSLMLFVGIFFCVFITFICWSLRLFFLILKHYFSDVSLSKLKRSDLSSHLCFMYQHTEMCFLLKLLRRNKNGMK